EVWIMRGQEDGPDLPAVERRLDATPVFRAVAADEQPLLAAQVQRSRVARLHRQGPHVTLDEHPVAGPRERFAGIHAPPQAFADGADIQTVLRQHLSSPARAENPMRSSKTETNPNQIQSQRANG